MRTRSDTGLLHLLARLSLLQVLLATSALSAPCPDRMSGETVPRSISAEGGLVDLRIPESLSEPGVVDRLIQEKRWWNHPTLYVDQRRREAYQTAFLEIALQPSIGENPFRDALALANRFSQGTGRMTDLAETLEAAAELVYARHGVPGGAGYIHGGTPLAEFANELKHGARQVHALANTPAFTQIMASLAVAGVTAQAFDLVGGAATLSALNHDVAWHRIVEIERILREVERQQGIQIDPALWRGLDDAKTSVMVLRDRGAAGAFVVNLDQNKDKLVGDLPVLALGLKTAGAAALGGHTWLANPKLLPFLIIYKEIQAIAEQEKEIHLASSLAMIHELLGKTAPRGPSPLVEQARCYAQYSFFDHMHHSFTGSWTIGFKRLVSRSLREWGDYYRDMRDRTLRSVNPPPLPAALARVSWDWPDSSATGVVPLAGDRAVLFVFDNSGSMSERVGGGGVRRIDAARNALHAVVREGQGLSIDWALMVLNGEPNRLVAGFSQDVGRIESGVDALEPGGETPLGETLFEALEVIDRTCPSGVCQLVLLSDGLATDEDVARKAAAEIKRRNDLLFQHLSPLPGGPMLSFSPGSRAGSEAHRLLNLLVSPALAANGAAPSKGIRFSLIAFDTEPEVQTALKALADIAGGTFYTAADAANLISELRSAVMEDYDLVAPGGKVAASWQGRPAFSASSAAATVFVPPRSHAMEWAFAGVLLLFCLALGAVLVRRHGIGVFSRSAPALLELPESEAAKWGRLVRVRGARFRIGRSREMDLRLADPRVSLFHAEIVREKDEHVLVNRSETNPVHVNGLPVKRRALEDGDMLTLGRVAIRFVRRSRRRSR